MASANESRMFGHFPADTRIPGMRHRPTRAHPPPVHKRNPTSHRASTRVTQATRMATSCSGGRANVPPDVVVFGLTGRIERITVAVWQYGAQQGAGPLEGGPKARGSCTPPPATRSRGMHPIMARTASPTKPANGTTNGHLANGNGTGNGTRDEEANGLRAAEAGREGDLAGPDDRAAIHAPGIHPYDTVEWDMREAAITNEHGKVVFEQKDLEFPKAWSAARHQGRGQQVLPRPPRHARARAQRQADDRPRRGHDRRLGRQGRLLRDR